jgi:CBS domain-containing protein
VRTIAGDSARPIFRSNTKEEVHMRCRDVMRGNVVTCTRTDAAFYCARLMKQRRVGFLPVVGADGRVVGVLTDRDLVLRLLAERGAPETPASELMTGGPVVCGSDEDLRTAEERMMAAHTSRLVVVDGDLRPVGVISLSDIAQAEGRARAGKVLSRIKSRSVTPRALVAS